MAMPHANRTDPGASAACYDLRPSHPVFNSLSCALPPMLGALLPPDLPITTCTTPTHIALTHTLSSQAFGLWHGEMAFVEEMVERDVRNNSAWNQRFFLLKSMLEAGVATSPPTMTTGPSSVPPSTAPTMMDDGGNNGAAQVCSSSCRSTLEEMLGGELQYVAIKVGLAPRNESCWNYLLGLFSALPGCRRHELAHWPQVCSGEARGP